MPSPHICVQALANGRAILRRCCLNDNRASYEMIVEWRKKGTPRDILLQKWMSCDAWASFVACRARCLPLKLWNRRFVDFFLEIPTRNRVSFDVNGPTHACSLASMKNSKNPKEPLNYCLLKNPNKNLRVQVPVLTLIRKNIFHFFWVLKQLVVKTSPTWKLF